VATRAAASAGASGLTGGRPSRSDVPYFSRSDMTSTPCSRSASRGIRSSVGRRSATTTGYRMESHPFVVAVGRQPARSCACRIRRPGAESGCGRAFQGRTRAEPTPMILLATASGRRHARQMRVGHIITTWQSSPAVGQAAELGKQSPTGGTGGNGCCGLDLEDNETSDPVHAWASVAVHGGDRAARSGRC
jgi:hypothetical protein